MPQKNHLSDDLFEAQATSTENRNHLNHNISRVFALIFQSLGFAEFDGFVVLHSYWSQVCQNSNNCFIYENSWITYCPSILKHQSAMQDLPAVHCSTSSAMPIPQIDFFPIKTTRAYLLFSQAEGFLIYLISDRHCCLLFTSINIEPEDS